jgi:drug/metabolite transporter (DMT)-like permease
MPRKLFVFSSYALVYIIWSTTYLAVKTGVGTIPLFLLVGARWFFSGILLTCIGFVLYKKNFLAGLTRKQILSSLFAGLFLLILNQVFFTESMKSLDTYLAAILNATGPLFLTFFDYIINGIKFNRSTLFAIFLGIAGISVLVYKGSFSMSTGYPIIMYFLGLLAFTFGSAYSRRLELPKNAVLNSTIQMYFAGIACFMIFFFQGKSIPFASISLNSWLALIYLIIFGGIGMLAFIYLIKHEPLSRVSTYTFVNALGATIVGLLIGEKLTPNFFFAAPMILLALVIILRARVNAVATDAMPAKAD